VLYDFSCEGLRTLVISSKVLDLDFANNWIVKYNNTLMSTLPNKAKILQELTEQIENGLNLVGISGIEDKLQEGVPQTIEIIISAGIRLWVLTGDKKETALNIGKTCRLIEEIGINEIDLTSKVCTTSGEIESKLDTIIKEFKLDYIDEIRYRDLENRYYMIIDGSSLFYILRDSILKVKFFKVGLICRSVICCRVSPKQKSEVVAVTRILSKSTCLSIGDGSNDVPMIMEANIGVGISGKEGTQAVRSSDYAIGQFKFLQRLLFVHGRDGYKRVSTFICYYFYKNIILVFADISFVFVSGFSGQVFFPSLLTLMYNCFWTSWPCIFAFGFERDLYKNIKITDKLNILGPQLMIMIEMYKKGVKGEYLNYSVFWKWLCYSVTHGAICYFMIGFGLGADSDNGRIFNHWTKSTIVFSCVLVIVTLKLFITTTNWNLITVCLAILSIGFYFVCLYILSIQSVSFKFQWVLAFSFQKLMYSLTFWYCIILVPLVAIVPDLVERFIQEVCFPTIAQQVMNSSNLEEENSSMVVRGHADIVKRISKIHDPRETSHRRTYTRQFNRSVEQDSKNKTLNSVINQHPLSQETMEVRDTNENLFGNNVDSFKSINDC
jgi:phospholipid-transporting ATPase